LAGPGSQQPWGFKPQDEISAKKKLSFFEKYPNMTKRASPDWGKVRKRRKVRHAKKTNYSGSG
jgi:hypothetical protein